MCYFIYGLMESLDGLLPRNLNVFNVIILKMNDQYIKHVGYTNSNPAISTYFSQQTVDFISKNVTEYLKCIRPAGIIVPCHIITNVMNDVYESFRPPTGDIYTRYAIPTDVKGYVQDMIDQTIKIIVSNVKDNLLTEQQNSKLSIWSSLYGTFNPHGLIQHAPIKVLNKHPRRGLFNMNY